MTELPLETLEELTLDQRIARLRERSGLPPLEEPPQRDMRKTAENYLEACRLTCNDKSIPALITADYLRLLALEERREWRLRGIGVNEGVRQDRDEAERIMELFRRVGFEVELQSRRPAGEWKDESCK